MTRLRHRTAAVAVAAVLAGCSTAGPGVVHRAEPSQAGGPHLSPAETLAGLPGVFVYVHLSDELKQAGLEEATLRAEVASRLRRGGVRVLTEDEMARTPGMPSIEVNANGTPHPDGPWILYNVRVTVAEQARLLRPPHGLVDAWVWNVSTVGCTGPRGVSDIHEAVTDRVNVFVAAYRAANPKR